MDNEEQVSLLSSAVVGDRQLSNDDIVVVSRIALQTDSDLQWMAVHVSATYPYQFTNVLTQLLNSPSTETVYETLASLRERASSIPNNLTHLLHSHLTAANAEIGLQALLCLLKFTPITRDLVSHCDGFISIHPANSLALFGFLDTLAESVAKSCLQFLCQYSANSQTRNIAKTRLKHCFISFTDEVGE